ncbi:MAG: ATP-binding cassette domain-containing protein [Bacteroidetes bacterium]|nr:ATP-binding cassette domain-containing protein [Bacteroidota bacterium]
MTAVQLHQVAYRFGNHFSIAPLSIDFPQNQITAIAGKSGSGKSTLLKLMNGLLLPTQGEVRVFGEALNYSNIQAMRLKCGYMVQGSGLFPHLSVNENISIPARIAGQPIDSQRVEELMQLVSLPLSYQNKYPHQLSGGEQQRVAICRALYLDPPLLLMDEPFGALDPITRSEIHDEMKKLQQLKPRTVVLVTHDMMEARRLADHLLILQDGQVLQFDETEKVFQSPAHESIRKMLNVAVA